MSEVSPDSPETTLRNMFSPYGPKTTLGTMPPGQPTPEAEETSSSFGESMIAIAGGTVPRSLFLDPASRSSLRESDLWFLMTDGLIDHWLISTFADGIRRNGMYGKACIITVFGDGERKGQRPCACNISVGLAVFAVSPHVAFLFTDVNTDRTYILAIKRSLSGIISLKSPTKDLAMVSIPKAQILEKDKVAVHEPGNISEAVNLQILFSSPDADPRLAQQILLNNDNARMIALTADTWDQSNNFTSWINRVVSVPRVRSQLP
ncbi:hypothetical protein B0H66DRAFT_603264 [Apodospora peruviana]|uniref:Uncharacterized protein n=1 Tax=Apodospora peruviana TaxID=516989 RepID=A0AAE0M4A1_9PEZI|nr:hypothetical protein B0H66DRAFT_603264 [Apodospora peruviana]